MQVGRCVDFGARASGTIRAGIDVWRGHLREVGAAHSAGCRAGRRYDGHNIVDQARAIKAVNTNVSVLS